VVKLTGPSFPTFLGNDFNSNLVITAPPTAAVNCALPVGLCIEAATVLTADPILPPNASVNACEPFKAVNIAKPDAVETNGILIDFFRRVVALFLRATIIYHPIASYKDVLRLYFDTFYIPDIRANVESYSGFCHIHQHNRKPTSLDPYSH
jgi:hypothetical protein